MSVTFDQATAAENPKAVHLSVTHPLVRQAAHHLHLDEAAYAVLQVQSVEVPPGDYRFGIYRWQKQGVKLDETFVPVASHPALEDKLLTLLQTATTHEGATLPEDAEFDALDARHHAKWRDAQANHIAENRQQVEHRIHSLTISHRARCKVIEDQLDRATNDKIRLMKQSELARANVDFERRMRELEQAAGSGDIHASPVSVRDDRSGALTDDRARIYRVHSPRVQRTAGLTASKPENSIRTLAADLYEKDTHFIFELIQNAEDNEYESNKLPSLHFEIRQQEIDGEFSPVLIVHNNETGFQEKHVKLSVGSENPQKKRPKVISARRASASSRSFASRSARTSSPIGFSSVCRSMTRRPDLGYIVPLWETDLPAGIAAAETTIILPLNQKDSDVQTIVEALRDIAPETILFLKKLNSIKISVHLPDEDIRVEIEKHILAASEESRLVELTHLINEETLETSLYWVTEVEFPKPENVQHEKRAGIESRTGFGRDPIGAERA